MAHRARKVKRSEGSINRSTLAIASNTRKWYEIPDYMKDVIADNLGWVALTALVMAALPAILGVVLGVKALPLEFIGVAGTENGIGINVVAPIVVAGLLALAIRPLFGKKLQGWLYLLTASFVFFANQIYLNHGISSGLLVLLTFYLYFQTRRHYSS